MKVTNYVIVEAFVCKSRDLKIKISFNFIILI